MTLPSELVRALDAHLAKLARDYPGLDVDREDAIRALVAVAVEREEARSKLRVLRFEIVRAISKLRERDGTALLLHLRACLPEDDRASVDRTLLELEKDGVVELSSAKPGVPLPRGSKSAGVKARGRGVLVLAKLRK